MCVAVTQRSIARSAGRATGVCLVAVAVGGALAACNSHAPVGGIPAPATYATTVRSIPACGTGVRLPAAASAVTPNASVGATSVLRVGDAVTFPVPAGARVGLTGATGAGETSVICRSDATGRVTLVARSLGYVRVGIVASGAHQPALVFVRVTP